MAEQTSLKKDKAYAIVKITSVNSIKPTILTGFKVYDPARLRSRSTPEHPGTKFSIMEDGPLLFDKHVISFRPKVGIHIEDASQSIQVKLHGHDRQEIRDSLRYFAQEDVQKDQQIHGEMKTGDLQYWEDVNGGKGASWMNGSGGHVWWEVVEVDIVYEDGVGMEMR